MSRITRWGQALIDAGEAVAPLPEYPRPQLVRESYLNLNGWWDFALTDSANRPDDWPERILVPFSPESILSGLNAGTGQRIEPSDHMWYRRTFGLPRERGAERVILHFGAVDQTCEVFVDGQLVGSHQGGYLPFSCDVTDALDPIDEHELVVHAVDVSDDSYHSTGKQRLRPEGIWYTAHSGIWQTVWAELVPEIRVLAVDHVADLDARTLTVTVHTSAACDVEVELLESMDSTTVLARHDGRSDSASAGQAKATFTFILEDPQPWSPEDPHLYGLHITAGHDRVASYAAYRSVALGTDAHGFPKLLLNGKPYLHAGALDQGYWPDSLVTPPSDDAMIFDIQTMKDAGFTMLRKHIKIEPLRWYHHCDRLGMLVWQDAPNGGRRPKPIIVKTPVGVQLPIPDNWYPVFGRSERAGREEFLTELDQMIELLGSAPSIVTWVPFNESWGQFDANAVCRRVRALDPTRLIDHASGWYDQGGGDILSPHIYFRPIRPRRSWGRDGRAVVITEYGGYSLRLPGHEFSSGLEYSYRRLKTFDDLSAAWVSLHRDQIARAIKAGLSGFVYTQLSDVEDELNGLLTADRSVIKIDVTTLAGVNGELRDIFSDSVNATNPRAELSD